MKKLLFTLVMGSGLFLSSFTMTSCKKDYTCTCNDSIFGEQIYPINDSKKDDAKSACDGLDAAEVLFGGSCDLND